MCPVAIHKDGAMRKYRGQLTIELEDQNTGMVETVSDTNMVTNAVNDLLGTNPLGLFYHTAGRYDTEMNWKMRCCQYVRT